MESMDEQLICQNVAMVYLCTQCNYQTKHKHHFTRHISTDKHNKNIRKLTQPNQLKYVCDCGRSYNYKSGLCKHKNRCNYKYEPMMYDINPITQNDLILMLIDQNQEFKQMMMDQNKKITELIQEKGGVYNDNSTNDNSTSNNFNLHVFLNVTCKDAINMSDFLNSINIGLEDLEQTGRLGYVDGISKIFIDRLNELNIHDRPMYCTDLRREIIYIKNNNVWEKETSDRKQLKCIINTITHKNMSQILVWQTRNPDWNNSNSRTNDIYLQIVSNNMSGATEEETNQNYDKIISRIARDVVIQKKIS